jgi:hypothetical protein
VVAAHTVSAAIVRDQRKSNIMKPSTRTKACGVGAAAVAVVAPTAALFAAAEPRRRRAHQSYGQGY